MKRLFWLGAGFGLGVAASVQTRRSVQRSVARLAPSGIASRVQGRMQDALDAGRVEMERREAQLRAALAVSGGPARGDGG